MPILTREAFNFTIVAVPYDYYVEFKLYEIVGHEMNGEAIGATLWQKAGAQMSEPTTDPAEAEVYLSGSVKWDGCSNWTFDEQDRGVALHACTRKGLVALGEVMAFCWDWAAELTPAWIGAKG